MDRTTLSEAIAQFAAGRAEATITRLCPELHIPGFFAGFRTSAAKTADLLRLLSRLHGLGLRQIAGRPVAEAIRTLLRQLGEPSAALSHSHPVAETLLRFGAFEKNPLLDGFTAAEVAKLRAA